MRPLFMSRTATGGLLCGAQAMYAWLQRVVSDGRGYRLNTF